MKRFLIFISIAASTITFSEQHANPRPLIELRQILSTGKVAILKYPIHSEWVWFEEPPYPDASGSPTGKFILRHWVNIPDGQRVQSFQSTSNFLKQIEAASPFPFEGNVLAIEMSRSASAGGSLTLQDIASGKSKTLSLIIRKKGLGRQFRSADSCVDAGVSFAPNPKSKSLDTIEFDYLSIECEETSAGLEFVTLKSSDKSVFGLSFAKRLKAKKNWARFKVDRPKEGWKEQVKLGQLTLANSRSNRAILNVIYDPSLKSKPWSVGLSLGFTLLTYSEQPTNVSLLGFPLTVKLDGQWEFLKDILSVHSGGYINIVPLFQSPSGLASARFYGGNLRIDYHIPYIAGPVRFRIGIGWFVWGMLVSDQSYGIAFATGPELVLSSQFSIKKKHKGYGYFKFSPLSDSPENLGFTNYELAFGAGYQFAVLWRKFPLTATIDLSSTQISSFTGGDNTASVFTSSLGVKMSY